MNKIITKEDVGRSIQFMIGKKFTAEQRKKLSIFGKLEIC